MRGRKGKLWETESRKYLEQRFPNHLFFKLINPESIDWLGFGKTIWLVESKQVKKKQKRKTKKDRIVYYPKENAKRRRQLRTYFETKRILEDKGFEVKVALLICKGTVNTGEKMFVEVDSYKDIKTSY